MYVCSILRDSSSFGVMYVLLFVSSVSECLLCFCEARALGMRLLPFQILPNLGSQRTRKVYSGPQTKHFKGNQKWSITYIKCYPFPLNRMFVPISIAPKILFISNPFLFCCYITLVKFLPVQHLSTLCLSNSQLSATHPPLLSEL